MFPSSMSYIGCHEKTCPRFKLRLHTSNYPTKNNPSQVCPETWILVSSRWSPDDNHEESSHPRSVLFMCFSCQNMFRNAAVYLNRWCLSNCLLNLSLNPKITGAISLRCRGKYFFPNLYWLLGKFINGKDTENKSLMFWQDGPRLRPNGKSMQSKIHITSLCMTQETDRA